MKRVAATFDGVITDALGAAAVTGFDSAWADKQPGAVATIVLPDAGPARFHPPQLATFAEARVLCDALAASARLHVLAIDQPTIVPNQSGARPVERALAPVMARRGGAIQPAYRGRDLFAAGAPIWRLLDALPHVQAPHRQPGPGDGHFALEVFPALALLGLAPEFESRGRVAKYNPRLPSFSRYDWKLICAHLGAYGDEHDIAGLSAWARLASPLADEGQRPGKADQDRLDAAICSVVGHAWLTRGERACCVIGDVDYGYIVTPASGALRDELMRADERTRMFRPVAIAPATRQD